MLNSNVWQPDGFADSQEANYLRTERINAPEVKLSGAFKQTSHFFQI